jgi:hypothetical protein
MVEASVVEKEMHSVNQPWHADQLMVTEGDVQEPLTQQPGRAGPSTDWQFSAL